MEPVTKQDFYQEIDSRDLEKTGFAVHTQVNESVTKTRRFGKMSPEILNPEFKKCLKWEL